MTTAIQRRRGTTAEHSTFTGLEGEISVNTTKDTLIVHDGSTAGGFELARADGSNFVATSVDINGGSIDGTTIGASSASTGAFTSLSASGEITANGGIALGDNDKATFGASDDLQIYHDGSNSYISDQGTGQLRILASQFQIMNAAGTESMVFGAQDNTATLYYDSAAKLATTATGIDVTGTATMDGLVLGVNQWIYAGNGADLKIGNDGIDNIIRAQGSPLNIDANGTTFRGYSPYTKHMNIATNGDISFYEDTGTTPKFFWDASAESLGIGTSTPASLIHAYTAATAITPLLTLQANLSDNTGTQGASIDFVASGDATAVGSRIVATRAAAGANMDLRFHTGRDTERMRIDSAGNVGIGVTPSAWGASYDAINISTRGFFVNGGTDSGNFGVNLYNDNAGWKFAGTSSYKAALVDIFNGEFIFKSSTTVGTAGAAATLAERMRIDSSGNLLVGMSSSNYAVAGSQLGVGGNNFMTRSGAQPLLLNRLSSDGEVLLFMKDGDPVGSIGTKGGDMWIGTGDTGVYFASGSDAFLPYNTTTNALRTDGAVSLGDSSRKFKDLYLSGGVYLGGTGAANKLDDYEEGTWTPVLTRNTAPTISVTVEQHHYTKVGRMVTVHCGLLITDVTSQGASVTKVTGLPFTNGGSQYTAVGSVGMNNGFASECHVCMIDATTTVTFHPDDISYANLSTDFTSGGRVYFTLTYMTA